jgi:hypothetical protein
MGARTRFNAPADRSIELGDLPGFSRDFLLVLLMVF